MILVSFGLFFLLLFAGLDLAFAMITAALVGMWIHGGINPVVSAMTLVTSIDSATLLTVPLFILASEVMSRGGMLLRLVGWSTAMIGHMRGSLSQVAITTNLIMAGISGSAVADAAATGGMLIPAMKKQGYKPGYPSAVIAAGAMLGPIIPPSIPLIVYAIIANVSIARLFIAALVPGVILALGYMVICGVVARRRDYPRSPRATWRERGRVTRASIWALLMPVLIVAGVRSGLFTDSEAAAVICLYAFIVCLFVYRDLALRTVPRVLYEAGRTAATVLFLLAASGPFTWLMSEARVAEAINGTILSISTDPTIVLLVVSAFLSLIGTVLEPLPAMVLFLPTLIPIQVQLGIDPIHFAMVVSLNLMLGMVTPPVGMLLFVVGTVGREPITAIVWESIPFIVWMAALIVLIIFFPAIATTLPSLTF